MMMNRSKDLEAVRCLGRRFFCSFCISYPPTPCSIWGHTILGLFFRLGSESRPVTQTATHGLERCTQNISTLSYRMDVVMYTVGESSC